MPAPAVIHLRELLSEKFPGSHGGVGNPAKASRPRWETGAAKVDLALHGGLARGALTEIVAPQKSSGGALLLRALLSRAGQENQIVAMVDGSDSLDVTTMNEATLARLLWVRCADADQALKAADLLLRDANFSLLAIDLAGNSMAQLRRIPATTWYRFQRLIERTSTICAVFTPFVMVASAPERLTLRSHFSLAALEVSPLELLGDLRVEAGHEQQLPAVAGVHSA